jgi:N-methylhydantoinase A
VENGKTLSDRTLIAFGGAAPLHVGRIAEKLGIARVIVPVGAGVGSAVGFLLTPISYEVARSLYLKLKNFKSAAVNSMLVSMAAEARDVVSRAAPEKELTQHRTAFARYVGQGHEIAIKLPVRQLTGDDAAAILKEFERAYLERYGRLIEGVDVEILAWTLTVSTEVTPTEYARPARRPLPFPPPHAGEGWEGAAPAQREVFDVGEGAAMQTAILRRAVLSPGSRISGPAMVVEDATSTVIGPRYDAQIADDGSIVLMRRLGTA